MSIAHVRYEDSGIAATIRQQIGVDAWLAVSAREPKWWTDDQGRVVFAFRFGDRYGLPKWCEITYRPGSDDYSVKAYKIHRNGCKRTIDQFDGVYADALGFLVRDINSEAEFA
jgi:hypothetical protein